MNDENHQIIILSIHDNPAWLERAADFFSTSWNIDKQVYVDSMNESLSTERPVPRWYVMRRGENVIGGVGLIENDYMVRTDLCPWLCGLFVVPAERGKNLGADLLAHGRREAAQLGFRKVYLNTDHVGYYEKYGWKYLGDFMHQEGVPARVYEAETFCAD